MSVKVFFIQQTVLFNWGRSQNSPMFRRIIFLAVVSFAYLKSLSKNDKNITHAQLTKSAEIPFLCPL